MATRLEHTKIREICFDALHPDKNQAQSAAGLLTGVPGLSQCLVAGPLQLFVHYDVRELSLAAIESILLELGLHLDNSLMSKLKRALYHYTENVERANLNAAPTSKDYARTVFMNNYKESKHGCRDDRPSHWREYL